MTQLTFIAPDTPGRYRPITAPKAHYRRTHCATCRCDRWLKWVGGKWRCESCGKMERAESEARE